jgi:hypothetical protein
MIRTIVISFILGSTLVSGSPAVAQSGGSPTPAPANAAPSKEPSTAAQENVKDRPAPEKKRVKKVWTNEDMSDVKGTISVVGDPSKSQEKEAAAPKEDKNAAVNADGDSRAQIVTNYREKLHQLHNQLDSIDAKITELRNFKGDDPSVAGGINPNHGYSMAPMEDQIKEQEAKRKAVQKQIDDLEDEARKNGLEPGELR